MKKSVAGVRLFTLFCFFSSLDFYLPIKVVYFYQVIGSYSTTAAIISTVWIAQAALELPTGIFSDMVGRKRTIILGSVCAVLAYLLYAAGSTFWVFLLGSILEGTRRAFFSGNNNAYLHNLLSEAHEEQQYHHYYGKLNSAVGVAMFVAALSSGFLAAWSIHFFMWINLLPQLLALATAFFLIKIAQQEKTETNIYAHLREAVLEIKQNLNLRYLSLSQILGGGGLAAYEYQAAVYAAVWPTWAVGVARAIQEGAVVPSFWYAGKVIDRLGVVKTLAASWITSTLGNVLAALAQSVFSPLFVMASLPLYGASDTAEQQLLQHEFTEKQRATIASLNSLGNSITFAVVLYLCGIIANHYGPFAALFATQLFLIPSNYYQYRLLRRIHQQQRNH